MDNDFYVGKPAHIVSAFKEVLFKPVTKILDERAEEIENSYKQAEETNDKALSLKSEYEEKLCLQKMRLTV